jgi:TPR repeat protein
VWDTTDKELITRLMLEGSQAGRKGPELYRTAAEQFNAQRTGAGQRQMTLNYYKMNADGTVYRKNGTGQQQQTPDCQNAFKWMKQAKDNGTAPAAAPPVQPS